MSEKEQVTTEKSSFDVDTTSLGLTILRREKHLAAPVLDKIVKYFESDGSILVSSQRFPSIYMAEFANPQERNDRWDPVVCVNVLCLFYAYGRGHELHQMLKWVQEVLQRKAYLKGSRYYETPDCFLFFISRLLTSSGDPDLHAQLKLLLRERVQERIGAEGDSLALAMRILACAAVGIRNEIDFRTLLPLQCNDGGWGVGWIYKYGPLGVLIGNRGFATALAIKAVEAMGPLPIALHQSRTSTVETLSKPKARRMTGGDRYNSVLRNWLRKSVDN